MGRRQRRGIARTQERDAPSSFASALDPQEAPRPHQRSLLDKEVPRDEDGETLHPAQPAPPPGPGAAARSPPTSSAHAPGGATKPGRRRPRSHTPRPPACRAPAPTPSPTRINEQAVHHFERIPVQPLEPVALQVGEPLRPLALGQLATRSSSFEQLRRRRRASPEPGAGRRQLARFLREPDQAPV